MMDTQNWPDVPEPTDEDLKQSIYNAPARADFKISDMHFSLGGFDGLDLTVSKPEDE